MSQRKDEAVAISLFGFSFPWFFFLSSRVLNIFLCSLTMFLCVPSLKEKKEARSAFVRLSDSWSFLFFFSNLIFFFLRDLCCSVSSLFSYSSFFLFFLVTVLPLPLPCSTRKETL